MTHIVTKKGSTGFSLAKSEVHIHAITDEYDALLILVPVEERGCLSQKVFGGWENVRVNERRKPELLILSVTIY